MRSRISRCFLAVLNSAAVMVTMSTAAEAVKPDSAGPPNKSSITADPCTDCHDDSVYLTSKRYAWLHSGHGEGEVWAEYGSRDYSVFQSGFLGKSA